MSRRSSDFQTIRSEGGLLPADLLRRVLDPSSKLAGMRAEDYGLPPGERLNDLITQSWNRLRKHWADFQVVSAALLEGEAATGLTNDKWNLPLLRELGFGLLPVTAGPEVGERTYPISRFSGPTPVHLIGCGLSLDKRAAGVRGAAVANPHGMVQEFLNRSEDHLWAIVSNGLRFRILRDNQALSRQSYLEFDLEAMFSGEVYSDFVLFWLLAHATRFAPREGARADSCWLEAWTKEAEELGTRALTELRAGVEQALQALGQGLVGHPKNTRLREALRSGELSLRDFHGRLLRVVYRLIFLFVAEDRTLDGQPLLHPRDESETGRLARERYAAHYGTARLRDLASRIKGSRHGDLWTQFQTLVGALSGDETHAAVRGALALPALGSLLWNPVSTALLNGPGLGDPPAELTNHDFLEAIRLLAFTRQGKVLRPVDYRNLGSEEFGGIYESFLALTPQLGADGATFTFAEFAGSERKTSGSYYTPDSLVQCLLDSALDPVVAERLKEAEMLAKAPWPAVEQEMRADPAKRAYVPAFLAKPAGNLADSKPEALATEWNSIPPATRRWQLSEAALLALKVCDPACGSGHFLVGAAHRLARHLARIRALGHGESEPSPLLYQSALRDVIGHCLYGVDINPMAVELCKVTLWLEAMEPGKALSFLDHHIQCGNSLLGATPRALDEGIPDAAFKPLAGDDRSFCANAKKVNRQERRLEGHGELLLREAPPSPLDSLPAAMLEVETMSDDTTAALQRKEQRYAKLVRSVSYGNARFLADAWCAAFVWKKCPLAAGGFDYAITNDVLRKIERNPHECAPWMRDEIQRLRDRYQFFHWHLAFPKVFPVPAEGQRTANGHAGWNGGFDALLGNPPWERVNVEARQFFATSHPELAEAITTKRRKLLAELEQREPEMFREFQDAQRQAASEISFFQNSGVYPHLNQARLNTYVLFTELTAMLCGSGGQCGIIVPSGVATDETSRHLFSFLVRSGRLVSLFDFENRQGLFVDVHRSYKFCLLTLRGSESSASAQFAFFLQETEDLGHADKVYSLSAQELELLSPISGLCPTFRTGRDREMVLRTYRGVHPFILQKESRSDWADSDFLIMFRSDDSSHLYKTIEDLEVPEPDFTSPPRLEVGGRTYLPVWESKLLHQFDHRFATFAAITGKERKKGNASEVPTQHKDNGWSVLPRYWVPADSVAEILALRNWRRRWLIGYRDITNATNERTAIASCLPEGGAAQPLNLFLPESAAHGILWLAAMNSMAVDYIARQRIGGVHLNITTCRQLPIIGPNSVSEEWRNFVRDRVIELTYTAWDLEPFALDCGWLGPPFVWDEGRRFQLRCELDVAFFYLYGLSREDADYILDTFPIVRRKDEAAHGTYRTKDTILALYDELAEAQRTGTQFVSPLDPPPADPACCHPDNRNRVSTDP